MRAPEIGCPVAMPTPVPMSPPATVAQPQTAPATSRTVNTILVIRIAPA
jgi:hypothetical protein